MKRTAYILAAAAVCWLASCGGGGDLNSAAATLIGLQRQANLTRDTLDGAWKGEIVAPDGVGRQAIVLVFTQPAGFSLDGSILIGENIRIGGSVSRDTFALANGVFQDDRVRFNLSETAGGPLILASGNPVLFNGVLSENIFISGDVQTSSKLIGYWEVFADTLAAPPAGP